MQKPAFIKPNVDYGITNKLNSLNLTVNQGTNPNQMIMQTKSGYMQQRFILTQKQNTNTYLIKSVQSNKILSINTAGWVKNKGREQLIYQPVILDKYYDSRSQLWRIVPYQQMIRNQNNQPHVFQYKTVVGVLNKQLKPVEKKQKQISVTSTATSINTPNNQPYQSHQAYQSHQTYGNSQTAQNNASYQDHPMKFGYGYQQSTASKSSVQQQLKQKSPIVGKDHVYRLGYQFQSGKDVVAYTKITPNNFSSIQSVNPFIVKGSINNNNSKNQGLSANQGVFRSSGLTQQQDDSLPAEFYRFPIKQKCNLLPKDKDTKGWFFIQNVKYHLVLQIYGGINQPGMQVVLNNCYGNRNQLWKFE